MRLPDYYGGSIVNLMASIQQGLGGQPHPYVQHRLLPSAEITPYRQVLLWVIDGLGLNYLQAHAEAVNLNANLLGGMTSVYPPTTASAITTFLTGEAPQQHGLTGWHVYFRELGAVLAILPGKPRYGGVSLGQAGVDLQQLLGTTPFTDRIPGSTALFVPSIIAGSDFNRCHLGKSRMVIHKDLSELQGNIVRLLQEGEHQYLFAYWPELDTIGHREGIWSESATGHLLELDRCFGEILRQCRDTETLIIVCADHGQIDSQPENRLTLDDHPLMIDALSIPLCGEPRSAYCYLRPDMTTRFDQYVIDNLSNEMNSYPSRELIEQGWFGLGEPHPQLNNRIGDRVLLMNEGYTLNDWLAQEKPYQLIGVHGGLSEDELLVPLVTAKC
ncbi:MAG: alkaline phosphatase family protein [Candidatus Thiodiazotropha sp. 6PLUC2]